MLSETDIYYDVLRSKFEELAILMKKLDIDDLSVNIETIKDFTHCDVKLTKNKIHEEFNYFLSERKTYK